MEYDFIPILERIKTVKNNNKITTELLSNKSGIPIGTLSKILAGITTEPKIGTMISLASALEVSVDYLLYGEESKTKIIKPTTEEDELIKKIKALPDEDRKSMEQFLNYLESKKGVDNEQAATIA